MVRPALLPVIALAAIPRGRQDNRRDEGEGVGVCRERQSQFHGGSSKNRISAILRLPLAVPWAVEAGAHFVSRLTTMKSFAFMPRTNDEPRLAAPGSRSNDRAMHKPVKLPNSDATAAIAPRGNSRRPPEVVQKWSPPASDVDASSMLMRLASIDAKQPLAATKADMARGRCV